MNNNVSRKFTSLKWEAKNIYLGMPGPIYAPLSPRSLFTLASSYIIIYVLSFLCIKFSLLNFLLTNPIV